MNDHRPSRVGVRHLVVLAVVVAVALGVRLVGIRHGLPFAYNPDEELHFVPPAVRAAEGDLDPGYFENPSGFTYVVAVVLRAAFPGQDLPALLADDPGAVFLVARVVSAVLGALTVVAVHAVGRRVLDPAAGLWAAALLAVAYLPVFYGHQALNDAATLLPVVLATGACVSLHRRGRWRDALAAGALVGLAAGTKYLAAPMALVVALAVALRVVAGRQPVGPALARLGGAAVACLAGVLVLNPYIALAASRFWSEFRGQTGQASSAKLGQDGSAWLDYPVSLLWGLGLVPVVLAAAGFVLLLRRDRGTAVLLVCFPVVLYVSMAVQGRWFGRWLLPAYPALVLLAAVAARELAAVVARRVPAPVATGVVGLLVLAQPLVDVARSDVLLTRTDTRQVALDALLAQVPPDSRLVVEPALPRSWLATLRDARLEVRPVPRPHQAYEARLEPGLLDTYRSEGWCWVVVSGQQRERGLAAGLPGALAYYRDLEAEGDTVVTSSPYADGDRPPFSFDFSFNYYPPAHHRPGPVMEVHRLHDC